MPKRLTVIRSRNVGFLRDLLERVLDVLDPPAEEPEIETPCPGCGGDVSKNYLTASGGKDDLIFFRCPCGEGSAWYWRDDVAQLIYSSSPEEDDYE